MGLIEGGQVVDSKINNMADPGTKPDIRIMEIRRISFMRRIYTSPLDEGYLAPADMYYPDIGF